MKRKKGGIANVSPKLTTSIVDLFLCLLARFSQTKSFF